VLTEEPSLCLQTGIGTFILVLSNRKEPHRRGKIQLIDATALKSPLRKNLGNKNCELTPEIREKIVQLYFDFEDGDYSKVFDNLQTEGRFLCQELDKVECKDIIEVSPSS